MFKIYFVNSAYKKDQVLMYDDTRDDDELKLGNPKLRIEVNAAGTLDFEIPSTNVAYSRIVPMVTELHVVKDNQKTHDKHIWFGRVLTIDTDLYGTKTCHCEGGLAYLNDCIYYDKSVDHGSWSSKKTVGRALFERFESPILNNSGVHVYGVSPQEASAVIANIMSGGSNYKENLNAPFKHLGRIAKDTDSDVPVYAWVNEPVSPSGDQSDYDYYFGEENLNSTLQKQCGITNPNNMTAIDLISSMMGNVGGLFWVSKTPHYPKRTFGGADLGDAVYVMQLHMRRYYPAFNQEEGQTIRLGENLTDLTFTDDGTTFFTAVHPHGQHINSGEDFTLDGRGVQTGTTYINKRTWKIDPEHGVMYCPELVEQYGMIIRDLDVGPSNIYEQLVGLGMSEIDNIPLISKTVGGSWTTGLRELTVKGIDLSLYNVDYSSIELTDAVRVLAPRYGIDTYLNTTAIDYDLQNVENTVFTLNAIKTSNEITNASPSYGSSSGSSSSSSAYVHPKHTEHDLGLYKISNDNLGHVDSAVAVSKKDITALGIPGEDTNTTYELSKDGSTIKMTGSDGSSSEVEVDGSLNTTYTLTKNGNEITLTGSDGIVYTVNDSNTVYRLMQYADRFNANPKAPKVFLESSMTGNDTEITVPNTRTSTVGQKVLYTEGYGNLQNTDKYASLGDILFTYPDDENGQSVNINAHFRVMYGAFQYYVNVYIYTNYGNHSYTEILVPSALSPPNIRWTVLFTETGTSNGFEKKTQIFRICIDQNSMRRIEYVHGIVHVDYMTGYRGGTLESVKKTDSVDEYLKTFHNEYEMPTNVILSSENASDVAFTGNYNDLSNKPTIPDISGKQDKSTAVTHAANTAVGSATKPVYIAANGAATAISHSINSDVPANAKFTDTTYNDATQSAHGLMTAADKKKLDGMDLSKYLPLAGGVMSGDIDMATHGVNLLVGSHRATNTTHATAVAGATISTKQAYSDGLTMRKSMIGSYLDPNSVWNNIISVRHKNGADDGPNYGMYLRSMLLSNGNLIWNKQTAADTWQGERTLLDSVNYTSYAAKSDHTHAMIVNSQAIVNGANANPMWVRLGTLVSSGNFYSASIRVWTGSGANGNAHQNSSFEIQIKDGWQSTQSEVKACGVTVYRINCSTVKVKVIPTAHDTYVVWVYMPWGYWNGNFEVRGKYKSWTPQVLRQTDEPEGTGSDTAYYDHAFLTSTVAKATEATALTDSGWSNVTTYIADTTKFSNLTTSFRRIGQIAWVKCSFTPIVAMTKITVCDVVNLDPFISVTPAEAVYGVGSNNDGTENFTATISYNPDRKLFLKGNFKASTIYRLMFSYPVT